MIIFQEISWNQFGKTPYFQALICISWNNRYLERFFVSFAIIRTINGLAIFGENRAKIYNFLTISLYISKFYTKWHCRDILFYVMLYYHSALLLCVLFSVECHTSPYLYFFHVNAEYDVSEIVALDSSVLFYDVMPWYCRDDFLLFPIIVGISWCAFVTVFPCHCDSSLMGFCPLFYDVRLCSLRDNVLLFLVMRDMSSCTPVTVFLCHCDASLFLCFSSLSCLSSFVSVCSRVCFISVLCVIVGQLTLKRKKIHVELADT